MNMGAGGVAAWGGGGGVVPGEVVVGASHLLHQEGVCRPSGTLQMDPLSWGALLHPQGLQFPMQDSVPGL